ncbi:hypothetical protein D3C87_81110 [compost metagenome]
MTTLTSFFEENATQIQKEQLELLDVSLLMLDYKFVTNNNILHILNHNKIAFFSIHKETTTYIKKLYTDTTIFESKEYTETTYMITNYIANKVAKLTSENQAINKTIKTLNSLIQGDKYYEFTNFIF